MAYAAYGDSVASLATTITMETRSWHLITGKGWEVAVEGSTAKVVDSDANL